MVVPVRVIKLDESHAALDQPPGQQAVILVRRLPRLGSVGFQSLLRLFREIDQLRSAGLHPVDHLVRGDSGGDLRVAGFVEPQPVQVADRLDCIELAVRGDPRRAAELDDRVAAGDACGRRARVEPTASKTAAAIVAVH
jgi:hypothetical protein